MKMKRILSLLLVLTFVFSMFMSNTTITVSAATKMTAKEKTIVQAYVKTIEKQDLKYINKYKYPLLSYQMADLSEYDLDIKLLLPTYGKKYDSKAKLYYVYAKGLLVISKEGSDALIMQEMTLALYLKTKNKTTYAYLEKETADSHIRVTTEDGESSLLTVDDLSSKQLAAVEKYLVGLYGQKAAEQLIYPEASTPEELEEPTSDTTATGTLESPIPMNETFTWTSTEDYLGDKLAGTYSVTVKDVKPITTKEIEALGFKVTENEKLSYVVVTLDWAVKNVTLTKGTGSGDIYKSLILPYIWGTEASTGQYVIGGTDYGFDGSMKRVAQAQLGSVKLKSGETCSFSFSGKILLPIVKGAEDNYLIIKNSGEPDYDKSKIHFKVD